MGLSCGNAFPAKGRSCRTIALGFKYLSADKLGVAIGTAALSREVYKAHCFIGVAKAQLVFRFGRVEGGITVAGVDVCVAQGGGSGIATQGGHAVCFDGGYEVVDCVRMVFSMRGQSPEEIFCSLLTLREKCFPYIGKIGRELRVQLKGVLESVHRFGTTLAVIFLPPLTQKTPGFVVVRI